MASTIYEVAALAGVSPATVSRVMNGTTVKAELAERVRAAADTLSFAPNRTARALRRQNSELIALIIPDIENPFFTSIARGVEDRARDSGFSVVLCNTDEDIHKEAAYIRIALSEHMAGVILAPASDHSDLSSLIARKRPVVTVDRGPHGFNIDTVTVDNRAGGIAAAGSLFDQGFLRVACITGPADVETAQLRSAGWRSVAQRRGSGHNLDELLRHGNYRVDGGSTAMSALLSLPEPPDAVVVANNLMGIGALRVLIEAGLAPPGFGLAVFGDLPFSPLAPAGITVIDLPARELGSIAASLLMDRINGDDQPTRTVVLGTETHNSSTPVESSA